MAFIACGSDSGDQGDADKMGDLFGPGHVDQTIRQAIQVCWMALPKDRRTVKEVETEIRRLVDRALNDLQEDSKAFGIGSDA